MTNKSLSELREELSNFNNLSDSQIESYPLDDTEFAHKVSFIIGFDKSTELWRERCEKLVEAAELGLSFAPKGEVPKGLDPTFYHTLEYETEVVLQKRIDDAREALKEHRKWIGES